MLGKLFKYWKVGAVPVLYLFAFGYILMIIEQKEFVFTTVASSIIVPILIGFLIVSSKKTKVQG